jgi:hypothetical protein
MILHPDEDDHGPDTVPTDHAPLEGEPRRPLYKPRRAVDDRSPSKRALIAILLVAICAVVVMLAVPVAR